MRFSVSLGSLTSKNRRATPIGVESNAATQSRRFLWGRDWGMRGVTTGAMLEGLKSMFYRLMGNMGSLYFYKTD